MWQEIGGWRQLTHPPICRGRMYLIANSYAMIAEIVCGYWEKRELTCDTTPGGPGSGGKLVGDSTQLIPESDVGAGWAFGSSRTALVGS